MPRQRRSALSRFAINDLVSPTVEDQSKGPVVEDTFSMTYEKCNRRLRSARWADSYLHRAVEAGSESRARRAWFLIEALEYWLNTNAPVSIETYRDD